MKKKNEHNHVVPSKKHIKCMIKHRTDRACLATFYIRTGRWIAGARIRCTEGKQGGNGKGYRKEGHGIVGMEKTRPP